MGEKYNDSYWKLQPGESLLHDQPLARLVCDPTGEGFPPPAFDRMKLGGEEGAAALASYLGRPRDRLESGCREARTILGNVGANASPAERVAAYDRATGVLNQCSNDLTSQFSQGDQTLRMLDNAGVPRDDTLAAARQSVHAVKQTATQELGLLEQLGVDLFASVHDRVVSGATARLEAAVNRVGKVVYDHSASVFRGVRREGLMDAPEAEPA